MATVPLEGKMMPERLVDVSNDRGVLHTFLVVIDGDAAAQDFEAKALQAAAHAELVPPAGLKGLVTQIHAGRGGHLEPFGDDRDVTCETKEFLEQSVREAAYFLWQHGGCPQGRADEFWHMAREQHLRSRAYVKWQQEGCPDNRAKQIWNSICAFED